MADKRKEVFRVGRCQDVSCLQDVAECSVEPILEAKSIAYTYPHRTKPVFTDLSVCAYPGEMLAVLGNNGVGKSTVLDLVTGITHPQTGSVHVAGCNIANMRRRDIAQHVAYVAQRQTVPRLRVYDEVLLGRKPYINWNVSEYDRELVAQTISELNLEDLSDRYCDELSGGERQKVFIARALVQEPDILVLDEPTSALDPKNQIEVMQILANATKREGFATVLVLHDLNLALRFCDRFILMCNGGILETGGREIITEESLTLTYGTPFKLFDVGEYLLAIA